MITTCYTVQTKISTLKQISNWQPSYFQILGNVFGEKYK